MIFEPLSSNAEKLLAEVLKHRLENGMFDISYWKNRFSGLNLEEDTRIRSLFKELSDEEIINIGWADGVPYYILLSDKGFCYFEEKKAERRRQKKLSRREWLIAIVSAAVGAIIGLIPTLYHCIWG